jgi:DNA-binding transcriptional regulator YhcF (GntR family)
MKKVPSGITPVVAVDRTSSIPLYRQIYDAFRDLIVQGNLVAGQQIPSTRTLAKELGLSRFPVVNAYAQLLSEGYFEGRIGSGTVVSSSLPDQAPFIALRSAKTNKVFSGPRRSSFLESKPCRGCRAAHHSSAVNLRSINFHAIFGRDCSCYTAGKYQKVPYTMATRWGLPSAIATVRTVRLNRRPTPQAAKTGPNMVPKRSVSMRVPTSEPAHTNVPMPRAMMASENIMWPARSSASPARSSCVLSVEMVSVIFLSSENRHAIPVPYPDLLAQAVL